MKRDKVCLLRLIVDSLPGFIRNSKILFKLAKYIFDLPSDLYEFRKDYKEGKIKDLESYYLKNSIKRLNKSSDDTDINTLHLNIISDYIKFSSPNSLIDIGCGTGYLLKKLKKINSCCNYLGIDLDAPLPDETKKGIYTSSINFINGEVNTVIKNFKDNSFDFVICTHFLEHIEKPELVIKQMRRISKEFLIIICPIEKPFKWGFNYHINFYPTENDFLKILRPHNQKQKFKTYKRLGDILYLEHIR